MFQVWVYSTLPSLKDDARDTCFAHLGQESPGEELVFHVLGQNPDALHVGVKLFGQHDIMFMRLLATVFKRCVEA